MQLEILQAIGPSVGIIKFFGLWRLDSKIHSFYRIYTYLLHVTTTFLLTGLMLISVVIAKNLEQFTEPLFIALTMVGLSVKVINILNRNSVAVNFLKQLEGFRVNNLEELQISKNTLQIFYVVTLIYTGTCFTVVIFGFSIIALGEEWILTYPTWFPFEYRYESKYYWIAYSYQFLGIFVGCCSCASLDMLHCYFMRTISLIYIVIASRLTKIGNSCADVSNSLEVNKMFLKELKEIMNIHKFAIKLTADCELLLSKPIFVQVLLSAFVLCFTGYRLSFMSISENRGRFIELLDYLFVMGLQIYLPCHYGNQITFEASKLSGALYNSNWTVLPQKSKKIIYLYMEFLNQPVYVKAGNFFQIGIPTFTNTLNNAYSLFAVLIRMKK